jgi:hypothetical protein
MRVVLVGATLAAAVAMAGPRSPRDLYRAGDLAALRHAVAAQPIATATAGLRGDRETALAMATALPDHPDADAALVPLAALAGSWDRALASAAATAAAAIAARLDDTRAIADELADDDLAAAADAWAAVAARADRWSDVRAHAVGIAARLTTTRAATAATAPPLDAALAPFLADPDPEVRRAALEAIPAPAPSTLVAAAAARVRAEVHPGVRLVAAGIACGDDPAAGLAALGDDGRAALWAAVDGPLEHPGAILALARCLAADDDPASLRALTVLRHRAPRGLRGRLAVRARRRP